MRMAKPHCAATVEASKRIILTATCCWALCNVLVTVALGCGEVERYLTEVDVGKIMLAQVNEKQADKRAQGLE